MQVKLEKTYPIAAPELSAWTFLQDIKGVAECMPGAEISEQLDDHHFKGVVKIKLGPATAAFKGDIEIKNIDAQKHLLHLLGKGRDVKGTSSATMDLTAKIRETDNNQCELVGVSEVTVNGKIASFGGRMITQVADQILKQFADNFTVRVMAMGEGTSAEHAATKLADQPKELNALSLAWATILGFIKSFFKSGKRI